MACSTPAPLVKGETTVESVGDVDVYVTTGTADSCTITSVGWSCGQYVWFIDSAWGTVNELVDWAAAMIDATGCASE